MDRGWLRLCILFEECFVRRSSKVGVLRQNRPVRVSPFACLIG